MDKIIVMLGIGATLIGIGFGFAEFINPESDLFFMSAFIWTVGGIATILGLSKLADDPFPHLQ